MTATEPPEPPSQFAWNLSMWIIRPAAAGMAAWSLYAVARHYDVPWQLALFASLVFDGIAMACLYQASEAVRAARSAALPILATLGMAGTSVYLNVVHARITGGGRPAEVLYATPTIGLLAVSGLSWAADRTTARAARGESPMRLPAYGALGWVLARPQAYAALKAKAAVHVTSGASTTHPPAPPVGHKDHRALLRAKFAEIPPDEAVQIAASAHPTLDHEQLAEMLTTYGITVSALDVALLLGRAAVPSVTLDRVTPPNPEQLALVPSAMMRPRGIAEMPMVTGMSKAEAITTIANHLGGLDAEPAAVAQLLAWQGLPTDTAYIRTALSRARKAAAKTAEKDAAAAQQRASDDRRAGTGFYP
ncbi:hypothetical protein ACPC54_23625 [Kitasatospora sp. NPDC094028]